MGGKSRKTGGVSRALIDRIKSGGSLNTPSKEPKPLKLGKDPFGLGKAHAQK